MQIVGEADVDVRVYIMTLHTSTYNDSKWRHKASGHRALLLQFSGKEARALDVRNFFRKIIRIFFSVFHYFQQIFEELGFF